MRYTQPQSGPSTLSDLARSLGFTHAWNFGDGTVKPLNAVTGGQAIAVSNNANLVTGPAGRAVQFTGTSSDRLEIAGNPFATSTCTYLWVESGIDVTSPGQSLTESKYSSTQVGETNSLQIRPTGSNIQVVQSQVAVTLTGTGARDNTGKINVSALSVAGNNGRHALFTGGKLIASASPATSYTHGTSAIGGGSDCPSSTIKTYALFFAPKVIPDAVLQDLTRNFWQLFRSPQRVITTSAAVGVSSSIAWLEQNDTASISASANVSGAANWTESSDSSTITAAASVSASAAWSESNDAASLVATASISAAASWTEAADTTSISAAAQVNCAGAWTEAADTTAITATVGNAVTASAVWTEASDSAAIAATVKVSTAITWTESSDIAAITASAGNSVAGNVAWTEANDVAAITAAAQVSASASWVEISDIASLSASVGTAVAANVAWAEANDTISALATVRVDASAGWAEQSDLTGFSAQVLVSAGLGWVEASDSVAISAAITAPGGALQPNPHNTYIGQTRIRLYTGQKRVRQL